MLIRLLVSARSLLCILRNLMIFKSTKSAVRFSLILMSVFNLVGCDEIAHYQSKKTMVSKEPSHIETEQVFTTNQLLRGVYSDLTLSMSELDNDEKATFLRDLLEGLVIYDEHGNIVPAVAESWQTKDNKLWQFKIRPEAKWSNGEPVTARDFVHSWKFLTQQNTPLKQYLRFINLMNAQAVIDNKMPIDSLGVRALDAHTLEIQLDKPTPYLPNMLAHIALLPMKYGKRKEFVGNGAYRFEEQQGKFITLEKNSEYWNSENVQFEQVVYQKLSDSQDVEDLDLVMNLAQQTQANQQIPQLCTYFYEFNFNDPNLSQSAVRTALVSMISSQNIVQSENLMMLPINEFLPRNMLLDDNPTWQATLVEQLLQKAGVSENKPLQLKVTYDNTGIHPSIANRIMRAWSQSDLIRVISDPVSWEQLQEKRQKGDFQVIRSGWCADYNEPSAFFQFLHSMHPDNKTGFKSDEVDQLLEKSLLVKNESERFAFYRQIEGIIKRERVFLPIFQYTQPIFLAPDIDGFDKRNPTGVIYSKDLHRKTNSN